ncbi:MAG TPA: Rdx family protein [Chitinophagaceae bacterium]|jgi:selenoprotein W-related protein|nr:Rdx family protein [Chitinophagaceae bacterium]
MKPSVTIEYCPKCHRLLRAAYITQEFLSTFESELNSVALKPGDINGNFLILIQ